MPCMDYNLEQVIPLAFLQESENGLSLHCMTCTTLP